MSLKLVPFESLDTVFYLPSIMTAVILFPRLSEILVKNRDFFHSPLHSTLLLGESPSEYCHTMWYAKTSWVKTV